MPPFMLVLYVVGWIVSLTKQQNIKFYEVPYSRPWLQPARFWSCDSSLDVMRVSQAGFYFFYYFEIN